MEIQREEGLTDKEDVPMVIEDRFTDEEEGLIDEVSVDQFTDEPIARK